MRALSIRKWGRLGLEVVLPLVLASGCASGSALQQGEARPQGRGDATADAMDAASGARPTLQSCVGASFAAVPERGWDQLSSRLVAALGAAQHSMQDVLVTPSSPIALVGKFAYGAVSKDMEHETVRGFLHDCSGWRSLGDRRTNDDGRVTFAPDFALPVGVYDVVLELLGDASLARGRVWVLPVGTRLVVSDIDGTLTTGDEEVFRDVFVELFSPLFAGSYVPRAYPSAVELTQALVARKYLLVYLTGRPYWLTGTTRDWLSELGFALGALHTCDSNAEALPTEGGVQAFKLAYLRSLERAGFVVDEAYGNAPTDVGAYLGAGLAAERIWIIGKHGGSHGTKGVAASWEARTAEARALPAVTQTFD
ncbi:MAG: hypothetical protein IPG96_04270 [Proteobacteria bacterium]|nr:hypothetical protein [Pseudomonadota bacterium]